MRRLGTIGCGDLNGALGLEFAAAADEDEEIALAGGGGGENGGGLGLAVAVDAVGCAGDDGKEKEEEWPRSAGGRGRELPRKGAAAGRRVGDVRLWSLADGGIAHCLAASLAGASTTTAAERSGMRWESDLSSLKTAVKLLMGLPKAEAGDGAGEFEVGGEGEIGIGVEVDGGLAAGDEGGAIGFADGTADQHLGRVEDADDGLAAVELIAFLGVAHGIVAVEILVGDHAGERSVEFELGHVGLSAFEHDFLAIALEFEDAEGGGIALIVGGVGLGEAIDVSAGSSGGGRRL